MLIWKTWLNQLNYRVNLKELRNCILCIIHVWSLFWSVCVCIGLHFLSILLVKLGFRLSMFWFFMFLFLWFFVFLFFVLSFEFNVISHLKRLNSILWFCSHFIQAILLKQESCYKKHGPERFVYKEKSGAASKLNFF